MCHSVDQSLPGTLHILKGRIHVNSAYTQAHTSTTTFEVPEAACSSRTIFVPEKASLCPCLGRTSEIAFFWYSVCLLAPGSLVMQSRLLSSLLYNPVWPQTLSPQFYCLSSRYWHYRYKPSCLDFIKIWWRVWSKMRVSQNIKLSGTNLNHQLVQFTSLACHLSTKLRQGGFEQHRRAKVDPMAECLPTVQSTGVKLQSHKQKAGRCHHQLHHSPHCA